MIRLLVAALALTIAHAAAAETLVGRVVSIADGDTLTVLVGEREQVKVRLAGIDAPDLQVPSNKS